MSAICCVAALLERQVLAREDQGRRAVLALDRGAPGHGRFDRVARTPDVQVRDQAQRRDVLDRLVGRAVFAQADRVVGEHEDRAQLHQRRHAQRVAAVVGEDQEGGAERDEAAVQGDAVHDRAHAEFAHAVVDVVARLAGTQRDRSPSSWSGWSRSGRPSRRGIPAAPAPAPGSRSGWPCGWRWFPSCRRRQRSPQPGSRRSWPAVRPSCGARIRPPRPGTRARRRRTVVPLGFDGGALAAWRPSRRRRRPGSRTARAFQPSVRARAATSLSPSAAPCTLSPPCGSANPCR